MRTLLEENKTLRYHWSVAVMLEEFMCANLSNVSEIADAIDDMHAWMYGTASGVRKVGGTGGRRDRRIRWTYTGDLKGLDELRKSTKIQKRVSNIDANSETIMELRET